MNKKTIITITYTTILLLVSTITQGAVGDLKEYYTSPTTNVDTFFGYDNTYYGQWWNFTISNSTYYLGNITLKMKKNSAGTADICVYLTTGDSTRTVLNKSTCINATSLTTSFVDYNFSFTSPYQLQNGVPYGIFINATATSTTNYYRVARDNQVGYNESHCNNVMTCSFDYGGATGKRIYFKTYEGSPPALPTANFTIQAVNGFNSSQMNIFNVTIDGTNYQTTVGNVTTGIYNNDTNLHNITFINYNFFNTTYTNYNVSSNLNAQLSQHPIINLTNKWNNSQILIYQIDTETTFTTTNGFIYLPYNQTKNITITATNYITQTIQYNLTPNTIVNTTQYQSIIQLVCKEISTNYTLTCKNNTNISANSIIYPNTGNYSWYIDAEYNTSIQYYNKTTTQEIIGGEIENRTISGFYNKNYTLVDYISGATITDATCNITIDFNIYQYTSNALQLPNRKYENNLTCYKEDWYPSQTFTINYTRESRNLTIRQTYLNMTFDKGTNVTIYGQSSYTKRYTNVTNVNTTLINFTEGGVWIEYGISNPKQVYYFTNDLNTNHQIYLYVIDDTTTYNTQEIQVKSSNVQVEGALVTARINLNDTLWIISGAITDASGIATILAKAGDATPIEVSKTGYITENKAFTFSTLTTGTRPIVDITKINTIYVNMNPYINCYPVEVEEKTCTMSMRLLNYGYLIEMVANGSGGYSSTASLTTSSSNTTLTAYYIINSSTTPINITFYVNGDQVASYQTQYLTRTNYTSETNNGTVSFNISGAKDSQTGFVIANILLLAFIIIIIAFGETKMQGLGIILATLTIWIIGIKFHGIWLFEAFLLTIILIFLKWKDLI